jgi:serine/threonine-protein kinase
VWALLAAVLVVAGLVAAFALGGSKTVMVPDLVGLTQAEAVKVLEAAGLGVTVVAAPEGDPGVVTSQDPAAGSEVGKSSVVQIAVFQGTELTAVPDVRGKNQSEATRALQDAGFEVRVTRKDSAFVDKGLVIEQDPAGGDGAPQGSTVSIVISSGPAQNNVSVPDVEGLTRADAQSMLLNLGLKVVVAENPSTEVATDVVIAQLPAAGDSVAPGTSIGIVVSTGPPTTVDQVPTPDVVGITLADAQQVISDAGLEAIPVVSVGSGKPANQVVAQTPAAGVQTQVGSKVVLFYSSGP